MIDALNDFDGQMYETVGGVEEVITSMDALKGKQQIQVNLGDEVIQFETLSQAIGEVDDMAQRAAAQMLALQRAGKQNTDEYKEVTEQFQVFVNKAAELEQARKYSDELKDANASMTKGLDQAVQGFQALGNAMQLASGIAGLFGESQEEVEKAINRTVQIMGILQAAQELYNQAQNRGTILGRAYATSLGLINTVAATLSKTFNVSAKASKALAIGMSAIPIFALVTALTYLITYWEDVVNYFKETVGISDEMTQAFEEVKKVLMGIGSVIVNYVVAPFKAAIEAITKAVKGDWSGAFDSLTENLKKQFDIIGNYQKGYEKESKRLSDKKIREDKIALDKQLLNQIKYNEAKYGSDWKYTTQGLALYKKYFENKKQLYKKDSDEYNDAIIEQMNFERDLANHYIDVTTDKASKRREIEDMELATMEEGYNKRMKLLQLEQERELEDLKTAHQKGEYSATEYNRKLNAINNKYAHEREVETSNHYEELLKLQDSFNKSFENSENNLKKIAINNILSVNERDIEQLKQQLKDISNEFSQSSQITDALLSFGNTPIQTKPKNIFERFIGNIKNAWKTSIQALKDDITDTKLSEIFEKEAITVSKLDSQVFGTDKFNEYRENVINLFKENEITIDNFSEKIRQIGDIEINQKTMESIKEINDAFDEQVEVLDKKRISELNVLDYQYELNQITKEQYEERVRIIGEKYDEEIRVTKQHQKDLFELNTKYSGEKIGTIIENMSKNIKLLEIEFEEQMRVEDEQYKNLIEQAKEAEKTELDDINLTEEKKAEIRHKYNAIYKNIYENHYETIEQLTIKFNNDMFVIEDNANKLRSDMLSEHQDSVYNTYQNSLDKIEKLRSKYDSINSISLGNQDLQTLGGIGAQLLEMKKFSDEYENMNKKISSEKSMLDKQFADGVITKEVYNKSVEQLNKTKDEIDNSLKDMSMKWPKSIQAIGQTVDAMVNMWASFYSQLADMQYNNEMYAIEQLEKQYDKENEILEKKLQEQQEIMERHNDNVQSIEDELSTARGDRRTFLVDQLNQEMYKREEAYNEQVKIERQQEALEKKREALEKKKEAAEKKRNQANQKIQIAQGLSSTALAVTNALSVQPYFLGVALAAMAAAMGAAQVAIIARQKFADGGLLRGKSHSEGGIPIGNTNIEVEGGEYVTNKVTTSKNLDILTYINKQRRKLTLEDFVEFYESPKRYANGGQLKTIFESGGQLPSTKAPTINMREVRQIQKEDNRPIVVSVQEINNVQRKVRKVQALAGINE